MSERLLQLERDLRNAVARHGYAEVQRIAAELCAQAADEWRVFPSGDPRARRIFDRLQNVLEWSRLMLCTFRASVEDDLRRALVTNRYRGPVGATGSHLRFDA